MKFYLTVCLCLCISIGYGQSLDLVWPLGQDTPMANLNFTGGSVVVDTDHHIMRFSATNAGIADSLGNLIMYTNGCFIANAVDDTMLNGEGLIPIHAHLIIVVMAIMSLKAF